MLNLAANFTTVPISNAAGKFRGRLIERSKKRVLQAYKAVCAFHNGTRDKYSYAIHSWGFVLAYLIMATAFGTVAFLTPQSDRAIVWFIASIVMLPKSVWRLFTRRN